MGRARRDVQKSRDEAALILEGPPAVLRRAAVVADVMREQSAERVGLAASGAAFWLVISAFPTAIAVVSLYGLFVSPQRVATDLGNLARAFAGAVIGMLAIYLAVYVVLLGAVLNSQLGRTQLRAAEADSIPGD
jgi:uncharacterized BrkB/YihY/UPF0761 family membrane protein